MTEEACLLSFYSHASPKAQFLASSAQQHRSAAISAHLSSCLTPPPVHRASLLQLPNHMLSVGVWESGEWSTLAGPWCVYQQRQRYSLCVGEKMASVVIWWLWKQHVSECWLAETWNVQKSESVGAKQIPVNIYKSNNTGCCTSTRASRDFVQVAYLKFIGQGKPRSQEKINTNKSFQTTVKPKP